MTAQVPPSGVERTHPAGHRKEERHYLGCFLGGAVGDALGAAVEATIIELRFHTEASFHGAQPEARRTPEGAMTLRWGG